MRVMILLAIFISTNSFAQMPDIKQPILDAMKDVSVLIGEWQGKGFRVDPAGEKHWSNVKEEIEFKLDGTVVQIEGVGKNDAGEVVHDAMGILYYDAFQQVYKMDSHLASGLYANASFVVIKANEEFQWSFTTPMGKMRYIIKITDKGTQWNEIGEFSRDETSWFKVFEMNLDKK